MKKRPLLLRALEFSHKEMEALLQFAVNIMHADERVRIEEESIINLVPELLKVARDDAPEELKSEWRKKLISASFAIKAGPIDAKSRIPDILFSITDYSKRSTCLIILFLIAGSDKHIDKRELDFIMDDIAVHWNYSVDEIIDLLREDSEKIFIPDKIIEYIEG